MTVVSSSPPHDPSPVFFRLRHHVTRVVPRAVVEKGREIHFPQPRPEAFRPDGPRGVKSPRDGVCLGFPFVLYTPLRSLWIVHDSTPVMSRSGPYARKIDRWGRVTRRPMDPVSSGGKPGRHVRRRPVDRVRVRVESTRPGPGPQVHEEHLDVPLPSSGP